MAKLICISGMNRGDEFALMQGANLVGRGKECQVILFDRKASRVHCRIVKEGNYFAIEDMGSTNGTLLNSKPLAKKMILRFDDRIVIGGSLLLFSDKGVGDLLQQTVTDVAAELHEKRYDKLAGDAAKSVERTQHAHHHHGSASYSTPPAAKAGGVRGFFHRLFHPGN